MNKKRILTICILLFVFLCIVACEPFTPSKKDDTGDTDDAVLVFSHEGGTYWGTFDLIISDPAKRKIYFTIDSTDPTVSATRLLYNAPITIYGARTIRVTALNGNGTYIAVRNESYNVDAVAGQPSLSLNAGRFAADQVVQVTADPNTIVYYTMTTDGSQPPVPDTSDNLYSTPMAIVTASGEETTYRFSFKAFTTALDPARSATESTEVSRTWIIDKEPPEPATGLVARTSGDKQIKLTWTASVSTDTASYEVLYGPGALSDDASTSFGQTALAYHTVAGLTADHAYAFKVVTIDSVGNRAISNPFATRIALRGLERPLDEKTFMSWGYTVDVKIALGHVYSGTLSGSILVSDVTDPANPKKDCSFKTGDMLESLGIYGNYLYVVVDKHLKVYSLDDPSNPSLAFDNCEYRRITGSYGVVQIASNAVIIKHTDTLFGVYLPAQAGTPPEMVYEFSTPDYANALASGSYLMIKGSTYAYQTTSLYDISTPSSPVLLGSGIFSGDMIGFKGQYFYYKDINDTVRVYGISNPTTPLYTLTGVFDMYNYSAYDTDFLYVSNNPYGTDFKTAISIYSLSNPAAPSLLKTWNTLIPYCFSVERVVLSREGNTLMIFDDDSVGSYIVDVTNKSLPVYTDPFVAGGSYSGASLAGNYMYLPGNVLRDHMFIDVC
ncbi:MAG: hypothetical protein EHM28_07140, partial [Spirochaetaceae bacterium]